MAMEQRKLMMIGGGAVVAVVVGWMVLSNVAAGKAEAAINGALDQHGMRGQVSWQTVSASPLGGSVQLDDVRIERVMGEGHAHRAGGDRRLCR